MTHACGVCSLTSDLHPIDCPVAEDGHVHFPPLCCDGCPCWTTPSALHPETAAPLDPTPWRHTETGQRFANPWADQAPAGGWSWEPRTGFNPTDGAYACVCGSLLGGTSCASRAHLSGPVYATERAVADEQAKTIMEGN